MAGAGDPTGRSTESPSNTRDPAAVSAGTTRNIGDRASDALAGRIGAYLLDFVLLAVVSFLIFLAVAVVGVVLGAAAGAGLGDPQAAQGIMTVVGVVLLVPIWALVGIAVFGYFTFLDAGNGTLGKRLVGLSVVDGDGSPSTTKRTAIRTAVLMVPFPLMALVGILLGALGFPVALFLLAGWLLVEAVVMFISDDTQRLGDKAAGTYVVPE